MIDPQRAVLGVEDIERSSDSYLRRNKSETSGRL